MYCLIMNNIQWTAMAMRDNNKYRFSRISGSVMRVLVMWVWIPLRPCHVGPYTSLATLGQNPSQSYGRPAERHLSYVITQCYLWHYTGKWHRHYTGTTQARWYSIYQLQRDGRLSWPW